MAQTRHQFRSGTETLFEVTVASGEWTMSPEGGIYACSSRLVGAISQREWPISGYTTGSPWGAVEVDADPGGDEEVDPFEVDEDEEEDDLFADDDDPRRDDGPEEDV